MFVVVFFLFCFCAPKKDDDKLAPRRFFCFVFMHPEKMTTSRCSLWFSFFVHAPRRW
jgi:hypothetical protein